MEERRKEKGDRVKEVKRKEEVIGCRLPVKRGRREEIGERRKERGKR